jgi:hypothetical protein
MPLKKLGKILNWKLLILALISASALKFYVTVQQKVPFQVEIPVEGVPKGYKVFPEKVLIFGKIAESLNRREVLNCFGATVRWEEGKRFLHVEPQIPIPPPLVEIEGVHPKVVEVKKSP